MEIFVFVAFGAFVIFFVGGVLLAVVIARRTSEGGAPYGGRLRPTQRNADPFDTHDQHLADEALRSAQFAAMMSSHQAHASSVPNTPLDLPAPIQSGGDCSAPPQASDMSGPVIDASQ
jgi:hypothetical protein